MTTTTWAVCPRCGGNGTHVNPAVDGQGITADEMAELGDDFMDDYMHGVYDIRCERCNGARVVPRCTVCEQSVVEGTRVNDDDTEVPYFNCELHLSDGERADLDAEWEYQAEVAAELRAGA